MTRSTILLLVSVMCACGPAAGTTEPADQVQAAPTPQRARAGEVTLAYESFGNPEDEAMLLIAGTGMQLIDWPHDLVDTLAGRGYRVIRFDNRDVGLSTSFDEAGLPDSEAIGKAFARGEPAPLPYTLGDMAEDAVGLLDAIGIQRAHIVGVSMGGAIAQLVAIDEPERVLSVSLIASDAGDPDIEGFADPDVFANLPPPPTDRESSIPYRMAVERALGSSAHPISDEVLRERIEGSVERWYNPAARTRQETVSFVSHLETARHRHENLEHIDVPTVVAHGTADPLVPVASAHSIAERIPDAELRLIEGMGHSLPPQVLPELAEAILAAADRAE